MNKNDEKANETTDADRIWFLRQYVEGVEDVEKDRYDYAIEVAAERKHDEPTEQDELDGFRRMIVLAIRHEQRAAAKRGERSAYGSFDR